MVTTVLILPSVVLARIDDFCAQQKTGQIVLHVKDGRIMQVEENAITKVKPEPDLTTGS